MSDACRWFQLDPVDACFFRDGYPFNAGEDQSVRSSIFPPHPPTVVGALRAALARSNGWDGRGPWTDSVKAVLGDGFDDLGALSFQGPFLYRDGELLFKMPQSIAGHVRESDGTRTFDPAVLLTPSEKPVSCDAGDIRLPVAPLMDPSSEEKPPAVPEDFFVTRSGMQRILSGELPAPDECVPAEALYCSETRIGIKRDEKTHTTGDASMYAPRYVRLKTGVSLAVGVRGLSEGWSVPQLMPLGGESRLVGCTPMRSLPTFPSAPESHDGKRVLILLSPAWFEGEPWWGAGPGGHAGFLHKDLTGTVASVAMERPVGIGGWDSLRHAPLSMHPCAPSGTVWWIEGSEQEPPDQLGSRLNYGFGLTATGVWNVL